MKHQSKVLALTPPFLTSTTAVITMNFHIYTSTFPFKGNNQIKSESLFVTLPTLRPCQLWTGYRGIWQTHFKFQDFPFTFLSGHNRISKLLWFFVWNDKNSYFQNTRITEQTVIYVIYIYHNSLCTEIFPAHFQCTVSVFSSCLFQSGFPTGIHVILMSGIWDTTEVSCR